MSDQETLKRIKRILFKGKIETSVGELLKKSGLRFQQAARQAAPLPVVYPFQFSDHSCSLLFIL